MEKRRLGKNLEVSPIGLGCMGFTHAYGTAMDENEAINVIKNAVDTGYTFFDTAECYLGTNADGSIANNEILVGKALKPYRKDIKLATKFGVTHLTDGLEMDSRAETIRKSIDGSLKRLQTDHIDLYYQHRIDPNVEPEEVAEVMNELIKEGKILNWGISETNEDYLRRAHAVSPVTAIQNRLSMMARWYEDLFPVLEELNVGFVAFSPLANGFLTDAFKQGAQFEEGDFRNFMPQYKDSAYEKNLELINMIHSLAKEKEATPAQISLAWLLAKKPYIVPIPGSRKFERVKENFESANIELSPEEVLEIDSLLDKIPHSGVYGDDKINS